MAESFRASSCRSHTWPSAQHSERNPGSGPFQLHPVLQWSHTATELCARVSGAYTFQGRVFSWHKAANGPWLVGAPLRASIGEGVVDPSEPATQSLEACLKQCAHCGGRVFPNTNFSWWSARGSSQYGRQLVTTQHTTHCF